MGTLSSCLRKFGLADHEKAILKEWTQENIADGEKDQHTAAVRAVSDFIERLERDRADVVAQIEAQGGKATEAPFKLADIAELTAAIGQAETESTAGWRSAINGFDGSTVHNYNPEEGPYWASMKVVANNAYAIQYFKGQTVIETDEVSGGLTATKLMVADKVKSLLAAESKSGIHEEAGQVERVTPAVVAESVKTSAKNTEFNPKQALQWIVGEVKKAIAEAPAASEKGVWDSINKKVKLDGVMNVDDEIGFRVFDVPGDGKFKVLNVKEKLQSFLEQVEKNPGFKTPRNQKPYTTADWQKTSGSASESEVREMLQDGDYTAAYEFSKQIGKSIVFTAADKRHPVPITDVRPFEIEDIDGLVFASGRTWFGDKTGDKWQVVSLDSGLVVASGSSRKAAEAKARAGVEKVTPQKIIEMVNQNIAEGKGKNQEQLSAEWLAWADEKEGGSGLLSQVSAEEEAAQSTEVDGNAVTETSATERPTVNVSQGQESAEDRKEDRKAVASRSADAGEELTYNKRNRRKTGVTWDDIADKNDALKAKEVVKAKVYPKPDYEAMVDGGMKPVVAHIVKQVYDSLAASPKLGRGEVLSEASMKAYIDGINRVMDGVMKWANDDQAVASWAARQTKLAGASFSVMDTFSKNDTPLSFVYPNGWKDHRAEVNYLGGNKFYSALQPGSDEVSRAIKDINKLGWPSKAEAWQKQGYKIVEATNLRAIVRGLERAGREPYVYAYLVKDEGSGSSDTTITTLTINGTSDTNNQTVQEAIQGTIDNVNGKFVLLDKVGQFAGAYESEEDAIEAARNATKRERNDGKIKEIGLKVTEVQRIGANRRAESQDVSSEDVKNTFGFRGVNFGNSMQGDSKSLTKERQLHLNHIYDSFMDLAELLNLPPKAMSLNGMLGIAVGAQGGGKALAHFVPGVNEINITRRAGAGSLAHEWGHALDHYFANLAGFAATGGMFFTEYRGPRKETVNIDGKWVTRETSIDGVRPEIVDAFGAIREAMLKRDETPEERLNRIEASKNTAIAKINHWINYINSQVEKVAGENSPAIESINNVRDRLIALDFGDGHVSIGGGKYIQKTAEAIKGIYKEATGKNISSNDLYAVAHYAYRLEAIEGTIKSDESHVPQRVDTNYMRESMEADGGKKKGYWSSTLEMFARAFTSYVIDSLEDIEAKNQYLAGNESVHPREEERKIINRAFDFLFAELKTKETDRGIAIYNKAETGPLPESEWLTTGEIADTVNNLLKQFKTEVPVSIIDREDDVLAPDNTAAGKGATSGFVYRGRIHLVREGLDSPESVIDTLFHELLHFGIRRFVPESEYIAQMGNLYRADPWIQAQAERWMSGTEGLAYAKQVKDDNLVAARAVDEALAQLAEILNRERNGQAKPRKFFDSVVQNVINWMKNLADKFGWKPIKTMLGDLEPGQVSRDYVESIFKRLREGENPPFMMTSKWAYSNPAFSKRDRIPFISQNSEGYIPTLHRVLSMYRSGDEKLVRQAGSTPIPISRTPVVLRQIIDEAGSKPFKNSDYVVGQGSTIYLKAENIHGSSQHSGKIGLDVVEKLPALIADPVAVFKSSPVSKDPSSYKILTSANDENGNPVVVAIKPNTPIQRLNNTIVHFQASMFPVTWDDVRRWNDYGDLRYYNEKSPLISVARQSGLGAGSETDHTSVGFTPNLNNQASKVKVVSKGEIESLPSAAYSRNAKQTTNTVESTRDALINQFGKRGINALEKSGMLRIVALKDAPSEIQKVAKRENASALYANGVAYIFADRIDANEAPAKLLHEIGEHHGIERMLGAGGWERMKKRVAVMAKAKGPIASAWNGVKANYKEFSGFSDEQLALNDRFIHEVVAKVGENEQGRKTSFWRELVAKLKNWLESIGIMSNSLDDTDIVNLVNGSLRNIMRDAAAGRVGPNTISGIITDYFKDIVSALKSDNQLIEDCA